VAEAQLELRPDLGGPATEPGAALADGWPGERVQEDVLGLDQVSCRGQGPPVDEPLGLTQRELVE
jgi:hypothetical protein